MRRGSAPALRPEPETDSEVGDRIGEVPVRLDPSQLPERGSHPGLGPPHQGRSDQQDSGDGPERQEEARIPKGERIEGEDDHSRSRQGVADAVAAVERRTDDQPRGHQSGPQDRGVTFHQERVSGDQRESQARSGKRAQRESPPDRECHARDDRQVEARHDQQVDQSGFLELAGRFGREEPPLSERHSEDERPDRRVGKVPGDSSGGPGADPIGEAPPASVDLDQAGTADRPDLVDPFSPEKPGIVEHARIAIGPRGREPDQNSDRVSPPQVERVQAVARQVGVVEPGQASPPERSFDAVDFEDFGQEVDGLPLGGGRFDQAHDDAPSHSVVVDHRGRRRRRRPPEGGPDQADSRQHQAAPAPGEQADQDSCGQREARVECGRAQDSGDQAEDRSEKWWQRSMEARGKGASIVALLSFPFLSFFPEVPAASGVSRPGFSPPCRRGQISNRATVSMWWVFGNWSSSSTDVIL
jgi:hypothetical protein